MELFSAIGGVASAATAGQVWRLSRLARDSGRVGAELDAGIDGVIDRLGASGDQAAESFVEEFERMLVVDGHRGPIAGGVVCEVGAPSSHAAIVSREIGVPASCR